MQDKTPTVSYAASPGSTRALAEEIRTGQLKPVDLVERCLDRVAETQPHVFAWREIDGERAMALAEERTKEAADGRIRGALHGIPIGVKDVIDAEGLPTRCNCRALQDVPPATADAEVVLGLKAAGAIVLGKLHTTEFAFFDPSPARNPHNTAHTPGGSSSGSGAAVAAGTVPLALGTQTVASVNRPAAYCGIAAFKPSTGSLVGYGMAPLAPSYDTIGFYGESVADAVYAYEAVMPPHARADAKPGEEQTPRILMLEDDLIADADPEARAAWDSTAERFRDAGAHLESRPAPISFQRLRDLQWSTMLYEAARAHKWRLEHQEGLIGAKFRAAVEEGLAIPDRQYFAERAEIDELRIRLLTDDNTTDAYLWPATPTTAPEGLAWTGDPKYIAPWTAIGGPIVSIPAGVASNGLPLGCILVGNPGCDLAMTRLARRMTATA